MEVLLNVLTAVGISGLVAAFVSVYNSSKKNQMDGIITERTIWREQIRKIADELQAAPVGPGAERLLEALTLRINPYGQMDVDNYKMDGHIWVLIEEMETYIQRGDEDGYDEKRKILNRCLSALLKDDWERTQWEIRGDKRRNWIFAILLGGCVLDVFLSVATAPDGLQLPTAAVSVLFYVLLCGLAVFLLMVRLGHPDSYGGGRSGKMKCVAMLVVGVVSVVVLVSVIVSGYQDIYQQYFMGTQVVWTWFVKIIVLALVLLLGVNQMLGTFLGFQKDYYALVKRTLQASDTNANNKPT